MGGARSVVAPARRDDLIVGVLASVVVAGMMLRQKALAWDDPYILFRYAENLVSGHGWTFNAGHSTDNAITAPLMVFFLAALRAVRVPMFAAAAIIFHLSTVAATLTTRRALLSAGYMHGANLAAALVCTSPAITLMWGMESSLYVALLATVLWLAQVSSRWWKLGLAIGLLALVRPDGWLVGLVAATILVTRRGEATNALRHSRVLILTICAPVAFWDALQWVTTGSPVPSTLSAKTALGSSGSWTVFGSWSDISSRWPWGLRGMTAPLSRVGDAFIVAACVLVVVGLATASTRRNGDRLVLSLVPPMAGVVFVYGAVLGVASAPWYWVPPLFVLIVVASVGFDTSLQLITRTGSLRRVAVVASIVAASAVSLSGTRSMTTSPRVEYDSIGAWLRSNTSPDATVAIFEIGRVSWTSDRTIIDPLGLLDRRLAPYISRGDMTSWISITQPDYWVLSRRFIDSPLRTSDCLALYFTEVHATKSFTIEKRNAPIPDGDICASSR